MSDQDGSTVRVNSAQAHASFSYLHEKAQVIEDAGVRAKQLNVLSGSHFGERPEWQEAGEKLSQCLNEMADRVRESGIHTKKLVKNSLETYKGFQELDDYHATSFERGK